MHNETQYQNPIVPGFAPDPSVVHVDGVFYLATSSFHFFPGLPIYASRDLKEWTHIGNSILDTALASIMHHDANNFFIRECYQSA